MMEILRGSPALSAFRINKLLARFQAANLPVSAIYAEYIHFADLNAPLSADDRERLARLLQYGPSLSSHTPTGKLLLVTPRPGTISPWSSKATDIAHNCGLTQVVRLERGDRSRCKVYSDDPVAVARSFAEQGASWVHVVDLSAAFGEDEDACAANSAAIEAICGVDGLSVDVGGGVRSLARIDELAGYGARRIALGTVLVTEPGFAEVAAQGFGELLVADIAARDGQVRVNGWRDGAGVALDDAVAQLSELGFKHLVYTDIARDGMQTGIDVAAYRHVAEVAGFPVVASGGISTLDDIRALAAVGEGAIEGAITGRALYEGNFTLVQALAAVRGEE